MDRESRRSLERAPRQLGSAVRGRTPGESAMRAKLQNRAHAGRLLTQKLSAYANRPDVTVLALPTGGVPVAREIATALSAPLDVLLVRKLGVPGYDDLAFGAVATGGEEITDADVIEEFHLSAKDVQNVVEAARQAMQHSEAVLRGGLPPLDLRGRTVILVDDGMATGATMRAAIASAKRLGAARIVVATGVAPLSTCFLLRSEADDVICVRTPRELRSIGAFYEHYPELSDDEAHSLLEQARQADAPSHA